MEIKKREVIVSVVIVAVMLVLGILISGKITDAQNDKNAEYYKAIHQLRELPFPSLPLREPQFPSLPLREL